jgi:predicted ATPase/DNA-binding CsgD family transcriptional regulator/transcriptional regulator with XRE-family HTH domain
MAHPHPRPFGGLLRQYRILAGLTQEALANRARLSRRAISDLERGVNQAPQPGTLDLLAEAFQLSAEEQAEFRAAARREKLRRRHTPPRLIFPEAFSGAQPAAPGAVVTLSGAVSLSSGGARTPGPVSAGLAPAPEPLSARRRLPTPPTPLFGRAQEVQAVCTLLRRQEVRLLTLTGAAGVGKTRLALQVAAEVGAAFPDGVIFLPLSALADPAFVLPTIAEALGLRETGAQPILTMLVNTLHQQQVLLILDNFEQVISSAPTLATLLEECPAVKLLVTSREVLRLRAEHQIVVPPLALPSLSPEEARQPLDPAALAANPAFQLFLHCVQATQPDFQVTPGTALTLARICQRLEGIPLALELAAPHLKLLSPQALLARLEGRLQVLTGGAHDLPERQRTMRATLAWSHELLSPAEQALFRRLAVFVGGWRLAAAEQVCQAAGALDLNLLEGLTSLLDKSLLQKEPASNGEPRFGLLAVLREFGLEHLEEAGELAATRAAHAAAFLALAEEAEPHLLGADQTVWLDRLEEEHDNLRAALRYALEQARQAEATGSQAQAREGWEIAGRVAGALSRFWVIRGHLRDWQSFLAQVQEASVEVAGEVRAKILFQAAWAASPAGDSARRAQLLAESLALYRTLVQRSPEKPALQRGLIAALNGAGHIALNTGDYPTLERVCEESLALCRQIGERWREAEALHLLALGYSRRGEEARGRTLCEASLAICRELGEGGGISVLLLSLGCFAWRQEDTAGAQRSIEESLAISQQSAIPVMIAPCLIWLGIILVARGQPTHAARLWGAAERVGEPLGVSGKDLFDLPLHRELDPASRAYSAQAETTARTQLGEAAFAAAWAEGRSLPLEQVVAAAHQEMYPATSDGPPTQPPVSKRPPEGLTPREGEVLRLLAQGLTNQEIAQRLVVSPLTIRAHLRSIYSKLGVTTRSAAVRYALTNQRPG